MELGSEFAFNRGPESFPSPSSISSQMQSRHGCTSPSLISSQMHVATLATLATSQRSSVRL